MVINDYLCLRDVINMLMAKVSLVLRNNLVNYGFFDF